MLFSENKLREIASLSKKIKTEEILNAINSIGFEVESCKKISDVHGIKFGHVLKTYKNSNSDNLNVCEIEFEDKVRIIQTTATNVKEGDYLIAFVPGSGVNGITFQAKEMKGIVSEGMLASFDELGFASKLLRESWRDQIFIFDKVSLKSDPIKELDLDDNIIDISILTNRSDANSYLIMGLEISAYFKTKKSIIEEKLSTKKSLIKITGNNENYISGIELDANNFKMNINDIVLLLKTNIELENDIIDFSSLTLIMTGVSSRVYNAQKISGEISLSNEKNFVLNDIKFKNALVVKNEKNICSLAGVIENENFKYKDGDEKALFELSSFDSKDVRDSMRNSKIFNNSSINCSKKVSLGSIELAYKFISIKFPSISNHINAIKPDKKIINFNKNYLNKYAGFEITKSSKYQDVLISLTILGFEITNDKIIIPSYRHDIETMQDFVEEVFRFYGLNNFTPSQPITKFNAVSVIKDYPFICSMMGYIQFWTYTLVNKDKNIFNPFAFSEKISLLTYVSEEHNSIRNSIAPSLNEIYSYNKKRKINEINFFDTGMINNNKAVCIASDIKTYSEIKKDIFKIYGKILSIKYLDFDFLHPNYNAGLFDGNTQVGWIGKMHPKITNNNIIFAEIIINENFKQDNKFLDYSNEPLKERDITISLKKNETIEKHMIEFKKISGIYEIKKIDTFIKGEITNVTFRIKMENASLIEFNKKFIN
ncbi:MAG: phenylalanine--tRNA ligase subunit beta [Mycoplasmataceae bacterium]|nr:phenylalanine--tRNA ligase subunit beta [Mycoplasmataceae bacterium]